MTEACTAITSESEANPDLFHRFDYLKPLKRSREIVAELLGVKDVDEVYLPSLLYKPSASDSVDRSSWSLMLAMASTPFFGLITTRRGMSSYLVSVLLEARIQYLELLN